MAKAATQGTSGQRGMASAAALRFVFACCAVLWLVQMSSIAALGGQTRAECNECCKRSEHDPYYEEQCILKCFRNHDHCIGKAAEPQQERPTAAARAEQQERPAAAARAEQPAKKPEQQPRERDIQLAWPNPLNLVAGKEAEAAARILAVNRISPQHPFYNAALQDLQIVLIDFVRKHPQGGKLPTTQLKRILQQLK